MKDITIIIPSYNPDEELMLVLNNLISAGFEDIIVVNDGSSKAHNNIFRYAQSLPQCTILTHEFNMGKGMALKTGFSHYLNNRDVEKSLGVITVDGDNQHHVDDVKACERALRMTPDSVILGARDFSSANVPKPSWIGNELTRHAIRFISGMRLSDTQCGLRAIPAQYLSIFVELKGERFEYETYMLFEIKGREIPLREVPIRAIYHGANLSFHYRPIKDTLLLGGLVFKFLAASVACTALDVAVFTAVSLPLTGLLDKSGRLLIATLIGRLCASALNFILNRHAVFRSAEGVQSTITRYYAWVALQMFLSYCMVFTFTELLNIYGFGESGTKLIVDFVLFFASFQIQRTWVFKKAPPPKLPPE